MQDYTVFWYLAGVPVLGFLAQWLAWRMRVPAILLLLVFGVLLGYFARPDELLAMVMGADTDRSPRLLLPVVSLCVAIVLFEGGLTLKFSELRASGRVTLRLVTVGALVTWLLGAASAATILQLDVRLALLLGAILVVTGPTVVMPMLRTIRPARRIGSILKWEGIVIDPVGAVLAVLVFEHLTAPGTISALSTLVHLAKTLLVGVAGGWLVGECLALSLRRFWLPDFLHGAAFLTSVLAAFVGSNWLQHESGLVTVTVMGIVLANQKHVDIRHMLEFKEHLSVVLISFLFVVLGSRLDFQATVDIGGRGLLFVAVMILVVRPAAVILSTVRSGLSWPERWFVACLAPRGIVAAAVASVFALHLTSLTGNAPAVAAGAETLVPITFMTIIGTVTVYGLAAGPLARRLGLADPQPQGLLIAGAESWTREFALAVQEAGFTVVLVDTNYGQVAQARMAGLVADCSSILSEHVREELDLSGIGRLLAMTPNDEINTLAAREFVHLFGRSAVFQLAPPYEATGRRAPIADHLRGRQLFGSDLSHHRLASRFAAGAVVKKTSLTESFGYDQFLQRYGEDSWLLGVIDEDRRLLIAAEGNSLQPIAGQTVIAVVEDVVDDRLEASQ